TVPVMKMVEVLLVTTVEDEVGKAPPLLEAGNVEVYTSLVEPEADARGVDEDSENESGPGKELTGVGFSIAVESEENKELVKLTAVDPAVELREEDL
ncbi:MAG: hypothetical protein Q9187_002832, partial [Circinaria calcarea]